MVTAIEDLPDVCGVLAPRRIDVKFRGAIRCARTYSWLGPLALARWASADPHAWHDVHGLADVAGIIGGWPPARVPLSAIRMMLDTIQAIESRAPVAGRSPCQPGDVVRFTHLAFWRIIARCVWVDDDGLVGLRVGILGREQVIPVPWAAVEMPNKVLAPQYDRKV